MTDDQRLAILSAAADLGFRGSGGDCGAAAVAINTVLFGDRGQFVAAVNSQLWQQGVFAGHVGVLHDGIIWDHEGTFEGEDGFSDFLEWGMLDPDDPDHGLSDSEAESAEIIPLSRQALNELLNPDMKTLALALTRQLEAAATLVL